MEQTNTNTEPVETPAEESALPARDTAAERDSFIARRSRLVADSQIREITALDGAVSSLEDLMDMPDYDRFYALVQKGVSLVEAYKLLRYDALMDRTARAAAREAMQSVASRQHLTAMAGQPGSGEFTAVPAEVADGFRRAMPGITDSEIRRRYRRYKTYKRQ